MKYSLSSSFSRLTLVLFVVVLALTLVGGLASGQHAAASCPSFPLCIPTAPAGWLHLLHRGLAAAAATLMALVVRDAWRRQREDQVLLPLATVSAVLFYGEAFVGAAQVVKGSPMSLVVLHSFTAVTLWLALCVLVLAAGVRAVDSRERSKLELRQRMRDFLALNKPWIVGLLLVTTYAGLVVGGRAWPPFWLAFWTLLGGALAAGGSGALNQYIDRELDKRMQRTAQRPLAASRLTPAEGLAFGLALCLISYYILAVLVNFLAALLALAGIFYYVVFYSLWLKNATVQNIVIGGGAGALPPLVGWAAATGHLSLAAWILFAIIFMWTPPHFWALAIVRQSDYQRAGVPMLPVVRGRRETRRQILIYTFELVGVTLLLPILHLAGVVYLIAASLLGASLIYAAWRVWTLPGNKPAWTMYRWSSMYLAFIFLALVIDALL